ncbi:putative lipase [Rosellinia necatrix]|uniref:sn-1-specific diacylglycerol lipase n=1 Tax=Rosellinia necatrix TaxID=77044 RepID=A0A1W2TF07_ROSNE|nr:putative lipase [Rosellinia necatrix]
MDIDTAVDETEQPNGLVPLYHDHDHDGVSQESPTPPPLAGTLLPSPVANAVSFATRSTSFALRVSTTIGGFGFGVAKLTTLSTLELGRDVLDAILNRAGRDVFAGSPSDLARARAESVLEMSLESLHQTMSRLVFWTAAGFHAAGTTASTASQVSQLLLSVLDQFFGSTDSSRAIASIITLVRREFQNPATGVEGERVGVMDLVLGLCGLAYLQNKCRKMMQEESRRLGHDEIIWDVIVLNDGERIDALHDGVRNATRAQPPKANDADDAAGALEQHNLRGNSTDEEDDLLELRLKKQITKSLPQDAKVSISTSTVTTKTITVDITGAPGISIPSFPSLGLVQSEVSDPYQSSRSGRGQASDYRVVYKVTRNRVRNLPMGSGDDNTARSSVEELDNENGGPPNSPVSLVSQKCDVSLPVSPKLQRPVATPLVKGHRNNLNENPPRLARSVSSDSSRSGDGSQNKLSSTTIVDDRSERTANQKRTRTPLDAPRKTPKSPTIQAVSGGAGLLSRKVQKKQDAHLPKRGEKKSGIKSVLRKEHALAPPASLSRDSSSDNLTTTKSRLSLKPVWGSQKSPPNKPQRGLLKTPVLERTSSIIRGREAPRAPQRGNPNYFSSRDLGSIGNTGQFNTRARSPVLLAQDQRRNSAVSLTGAISIHSYGSQSPSPPHQNEKMPASGISKQDQAYGVGLGPPSPRHPRHQTTSRPPSGYAPSIYTLGTQNSESSLVISSFHPKSVYGDSMALDYLRRSGGVRGMFPDFHFLRNVTRYSRYASAVYGYNFLKLMGISKDRPTQEMADEIHYDVRSFAHHAKLPPDSILLASFVDPQGGSDSTGATDTGVPLVHTVTLDEESKAVVLTCRGTLGFEDVLADMMCEYDDLIWRGKTYKVHKGIHASARRLLYGGDGRVMVTIKVALEEYPDYGLVLCGHSLGGAVTALLGVMLAEPSLGGAGFLTSATEHTKLLNDTGPFGIPTNICLPSGRPIHVYAYGPPATMSPSLQKATRGLITSMIHGNDMVPYLSLGVLHDFQALALAFKTDNSEAKAEVKRRVWEGLRSGLADKWYGNLTGHSNEDDEHWGFVALKTLRASMMNPKLLPPGEVFKVESTAVMRRDAFTQEAIEDIGRPATRIVLKYVRDVEAHFREVRFGSSMLTDHSPGRYEDVLRRLTSGVVEI